MDILKQLATYILLSLAAFESRSSEISLSTSIDPNQKMGRYLFEMFISRHVNFHQLQLLSIPFFNPLICEGFRSRQEVSYDIYKN